jgi:cobalt/nickel transport system permease protein
MRLDWLEPDRSADGPLHRLDPRLKLLATLALVVSVVLLPIGAWRPLGAAAIALALFVGLSGVPPGILLRRALAVLPVVVLIAAMIAPSHPMAPTLGPLAVGAGILAKNCVTILSVLLLAHVTPFRDLMSALTRLRTPAVLVSTLLLMYRYLFVLADQLGRMARARRSRSFRRSRWSSWPLGASLIAGLLLRSFERGERVHAAMLARGWDGTFRSLDGPDLPDR